MTYKIKYKEYELLRDFGNEVCDPAAVFEALKDDYSPIQETLYALILTTKNKIIEKYEIAKGGINSVNVSAADLFRHVLISGGDRFILAHNHPSGELSPSEDDLKFTQKVLSGCKVIGLDLLDHIIFNETEWYSMKKEGLIL